MLNKILLTISILKFLNSINFIFAIIYTLCMMPRLRLGRETKSLQNEAGRSIFTSKFVFLLVTKSTQQNPKTMHFLKVYASKQTYPTTI